MFAAVCTKFDRQDPLSGLELVDAPELVAQPGWEVVRVKYAALNYHDITTLEGIGPSAEALPIALGCEGSGWTAAGQEVVIHGVLAEPGRDERYDFSILSERHPGTLAEYVAVPARNVVAKPDGISMEAAACLSISWLTAFRMLFTRAGLGPGDRVLVQGAGGGVSTAAIVLARAAGIHVTAASRSPAKLQPALDLGAHEAIATGDRPSHKVDAVIDTVGAATWEHSLRALAPGGTLVVAGGVSGTMVDTNLVRIFLRQHNILGSSAGTLAELHQLMGFVTSTGIEPAIHRIYPRDHTVDAFRALRAGEQVGKLIVDIDG